MHFGFGDTSPFRENSLIFSNNQNLYILEHRSVSERKFRLKRVVASLMKRAGDSACIEWSAGFCGGGYGTISLGGDAQRAHRVIYEIFKGAIPSGLVIRHSCDNPPCCNPHHLLTGTHQENSDDKIRRGRMTNAINKDLDDLVKQDILSGFTQCEIIIMRGVSDERIRRIKKTMHPEKATVNG